MEMVLAMEYSTPRAQVQIYRPILTEQEREKRMRQIHDAACRLVLAEERRKEAQSRGSLEGIE